MLNKSTRRTLMLCLLVMLVMMVVPAPQAAHSASTRSMDDALLLMLASQSRLYDTPQPVSLRVPGLAAPAQQVAPQRVTPDDINEQQMLADYYQQFADNLPDDSTARSALEARADTHQNAAQSLARIRQRQYRRGKGFQLFVRNGARQIGRAADSVIHFTGRVGKVALIIARDEIIIRAKNIVRAQVQDLMDIAEGKLDSVVNRLARKFGMPAAELLRQFVIDPAFARLRGQVERHVSRVLDGREEASADTGGDGEETEDDEPQDEEHQTDWSSVGPEGETEGYDDPDEADVAEEDQAEDQAGESEEEDEGPTNSNQQEAPEVYDLEGWFSASSCNRLGSNIPSWMPRSEASASQMGDMLWLECHWTTDLRESSFGCDADGNRCPRLPGRAEVAIYALPTIAETQERFRAYTTECSQSTDPTCFTDIDRLTWYYSEADHAFQEGIAHFTRIIALNDNAIIEVWWGGSEHESDPYGLLNSAQALVDPLQQ